MKRKVLAMLLMCVIGSSSLMSGCGNAKGTQAEATETPEVTATPETTKTPEATATPEITETPEATATPEITEEPEATETPKAEAVDQEELDAKIQSMLPILDSVGANYDMVGKYDPQDAEVLWSQLYLVAVNWISAENGDATMSEGYHRKIVPASLVRDYAAAFMEGFTELPAIPDGRDNVQYDEDTDTYSFAMSDRGESETTLQEYAVENDGITTKTRAASPYDPDSGWSEKTLHLVKNTYSQDGSEPLFPFTVEQITDFESSYKPESVTQ